MQTLSEMSAGSVLNVTAVRHGKSRTVELTLAWSALLSQSRAIGRSRSMTSALTQ